MSWLATYTPGFAIYGQPYEAGTLAVDVQHFGLMLRGQTPKPMTKVIVTKVSDLEFLTGEEWFTCDIETGAVHPDQPWTGKDPTQARLKMVGFGTESVGATIIWSTASDAVKARVKWLLETRTKLKSFHNGHWFDIRVLRRYGMKVRRVIDTRDMRRAQSSTSRLSLGFLSSIYDFTNNWKAAEASADDPDTKVVFTRDLKKLGEYCAQDCVQSARLTRGLWAETWGTRETTLYNVHADLARLTAEMHDTGIYVNKRGRGFLRHLLSQSIAEKWEALVNLVGIVGWYPSADNMRSLLYRRHAMQKRIADDTGAVTKRKSNATSVSWAMFNLPDPVNPRQYSDEEMECISVDEPSLLLLLVSGSCPDEAVPIIEAWWAYQQDVKRMGMLKSTDFTNAIGKDGRLRPGWNSCGTDTGRWSCSEPNVQNIEQALRLVFSPAPGNCIVHADKCLVPETRVLKADLTWVPIGSLKVGDELVGFDESLGAKCRMRSSFVQKTDVIQKRCLKVKTDKGEVTCSDNHMFVVRGEGRGPVFCWVQAKDLRVGDLIKHFVEPWEVDRTYGGAYLAGIYDGEGCLSKNDVSFTQNKGLIFDHVKKLVHARGFETYERDGLSNSKTAMQLHLTGQRAGLRFVGSIRPRRLLAKARQMWEGSRPHGRLTTAAVVTGIEEAGVQEVVALGTSTKTLVAEGFLSHNSQLELRVMEATAGDRKLKAALDTGDVYSFDARNWFRLGDGFDVKKLKPGARKSAKIIHLGRQYRAGINAVYAQALMQDRSFTYERTKLLCGEFDTLYCDTVSYWHSEQAKVLDCGYSESSILHRRRNYPVPPEPSDIANYPIQSTAADMMNLETIALWKRLKKEVPRARIISQQHDAVDVEAPEFLESKVTRIVLETMSRSWTIRNRTRDFPMEIKVAHSSEDGTLADL